MAYWSGNKLKLDPGNRPRVSYNYEIWVFVAFLVVAVLVKLFG